MDFVSFFIGSFFTKVPVVAFIISVIFIASCIAMIGSWKNKKLNNFSRYAPTILTTAGLFGTFIGLTYGLRAIQTSTDGSINANSISKLIEHLKVVFVYALSGVLSSLIFMILNTFILKIQNAEQKQISDRNRQDAKTYNQNLLDLQQAQTDHLAELFNLQTKNLRLQQESLEQQTNMQEHISKIQKDNDTEQLAQLISLGVVRGLNPLLMEIKTAVADQGTEAIKKVLEDLKSEILVPMKGALDNTNNALETTNQAVKATIIAIEESQEHNNKLIAAVETAATKMESASEKMNGLVDKIDGTVQTMDDMQKRQEKSLEKFNTDLQDNLGKIKPAIEDGMKVAETNLVTAINETSQAMQRDVKQVLVDTTGELKDTISVATTGMKEASQEMQILVGKIDTTVQHMDNIQKEQKESLDNFNKELKTNLDTIEPSIKNGLDHAKEALTTAIGTAAILMKNSINDASNKMKDNIDRASQDMVDNIGNACKDMTNTITETLKISGEELVKSVNEATTELNKSVTATIDKQNESINELFKKFDDAQEKFDRILVDFSGRMEGHIINMATTLKSIGENAESMINTASENLKATLGDIDNKLLNTAEVLEKSLEDFRIQYQESLTSYLNQQTENLNGFLERQNEQLEQTIGEQRKGLVEITNNLTEQFKFMDAKQREVNTEINRLVSRIEAIQEAIIPKVQSIAKELNKGEEILSRELRQSTEHLTTVSQALENMGRDLPEEFAKAFKELDKTYQDAFKDLDSGLKDAVNNLRGAVAALAAAIPLHDAMNQR